MLGAIALVLAPASYPTEQGTAGSGEAVAGRKLGADEKGAAKQESKANLRPEPLSSEPRSGTRGSKGEKETPMTRYILYNIALGHVAGRPLRRPVWIVR